MKKSLLLAAALLAGAASQAATPKAAMFITENDESKLNFQENAALLYFKANYSDGVVLTPATFASRIDDGDIATVWIHVDNVGVGKGNLPAALTDAANVEALSRFNKDGGTILLTKQATQLLSKIGRIDATFDPNIYGDGDGGKGTDVWAINAHLGWWQLNPDNKDQDPSQVYDRRSHAIYAGLQTDPSTFAWETFPMEGTGNGTEMHREDHNCMWDLNAYQYTAEGKNTMERFETQNNCVILGTWGHVQDYAVAGIVEFLPRNVATKADNYTSGNIIANGLAACEWSPREGVNAFHANLEKLTGNCIDYLVEKSTIDFTGVESIATEEGAPEYYTLQGVKVANPENGIYVKVCAGKASKVLVK